MADKIRNNTFLIKRSNVPGKVPTAGSLLLGELALNTSDVILYASGTTANSILPIGWDRVSRTGDTMTGSLYAPSISATTISATTYLNLPSSTFTGGTVTGPTNFTNGLTANTMSATTYYGDGSNLTGISAVATEFVVNCRNQSGSDMYRGQVVYMNGSTGNKPTILLAQANSEMTSARTFGVLKNDIANNDYGDVVTIGSITNLDTRTSATHPFTIDTLSDGQTIYLSPTNAGYITNVKPYAPNHLVYIGKVVRTSPTNGYIEYQIQNGYELDELHDVKITGVTYGDLLTYSAYNGSNVWVNSKTLNGSYTVTGDTSVGGQMKATTVSATTYYNLPITTDITITGATYSNNTFTYRNNTGGTFSTLFNTVTGLTVTGNLTVTGGTQSIFSGNSSSDLVRITQTGTGNAFVVEDSTTPDSSKFVINSSGNVGVGIDSQPTTKLYVNNNALDGVTNVIIGYNGISSGGTGVYGISSLPAVNGTSYGVRGESNENSVSNIGVYGYAWNSDWSGGINKGGLFIGEGSNTNIGVDATGQAANSNPSPLSIGGKFTAQFSDSNYSVQLIDGTQGINKVLVSQTTDGKANWSDVLSGLTRVNTTTISATTYQNLPLDIRVTGGTYSTGTATFTNNTGGTFSVTGFSTATAFTGGTVTGATNFTGGLTANTISATTYLNLPVTTDITITGASYSNNTFTYTNNTGGTFNVLFNTVTGLTSTGTISSSILSATTYLNLPLDIRVTGGTYTNGNATFTNNTGGTFNVTGFSTSTATAFTGGTVTGATNFTGGVTANTISATTYQNLPTDIRVTGATYSNNTFTFTNNTGGTFSTLFNTVTGLTVNGNLTVTGNTSVQGLSGTTATLSGSGQNILTIIGSGTTSPIFTVQGSSGELFSITDSLTGSLFSVNDISGLPILEVFSDNTTLMGSYLAPSLNTTTKVTLTAGTNTVYSIPTSAYTGAFFDYTVISSGSTGARAGNIMAIWSGTSAQYSETSTNDIGNTAGITFSVAVSGNNAVLSSSATTGGWTLKTIIRSI